MARAPQNLAGLDSVVLTDRERVDALIVEASRFPETPGVARDLAADVVGSMHAHLGAVDAVLGGHATGVSDEVRAALAEFRSRPEPAQLELLVAAWRRYDDIIDRLLDDVRQTLSQQHLDKLGFDFSDQLEAHGYRRRPPVASPHT